MKSYTKSNLIILGTFFALLLISTINLNYSNSTNDKGLSYSDDFSSNVDNLQLSKVSGKIQIDNNWTAAKAIGICTGNGTFSNPYIIEDLEINSGGSGNCILIENSDVYFKIENCTLNAGYLYPNAGIRLNNVTKGKLIINNCSFSFIGIYLSYCDNITISGNIANNNQYGIKLYSCNNNTITGNTANNNSYWGLHLRSCENNVVSTNIANENYYGILIEVCYNNIISGNTANNNSYYGIELNLSDFNMILGNTVNNNSHYGIFLSRSDYNTITGNTLIGNNKCIHEEKCRGNTFSDNGDCTYGQGDGAIPGYNLYLLLGILSVVAIIISKKVKKS